jgi:hypothetical protein
MSMGGMDMDLNDYDWDAYLTNDRTLSDPDVVRVERSGRVRLRIINMRFADSTWGPCLASAQSCEVAS